MTLISLDIFKANVFAIVRMDLADPQWTVSDSIIENYYGRYITAELSITEVIECLTDPQTRRDYGCP